MVRLVALFYGSPCFSATKLPLTIDRSARAPSAKKAMNPVIRDLRAGMKEVSPGARVLEIPEPNKVYTRHGTVACVTNALIGDQTGTIRMNLWNRQINMVSKGDLIRIENGTVARFRGKRQLRIGKHGKIAIVQDANLQLAANGY